MSEPKRIPFDTIERQFVSYNYSLISPYCKRQLVVSFCEFFECFYGRQPDIDDRNIDCGMWLAFFTGYIQSIKDTQNEIETWERI